MSKSGTLPQFGKDSDRVFFVDADSDNNQLFKSVSVTGADPITHLKATNAAEFALSPNEQFIGWTERYQAYVMPFVRSGRSIDIAADAKALPQTQGQRRRRRLSPLVGRRQHALLDARARPLRAAASTSPPSTAPRRARSPPIAHLGFVATEPHPTGHDRADQRAHRHHDTATR